jgi:hypothetical protein
VEGTTEALDCSLQLLVSAKDQRRIIIIIISQGVADLMLGYSVCSFDSDTHCLRGGKLRKAGHSLRMPDTPAYDERSTCNMQGNCAHARHSSHILSRYTGLAKYVCKKCRRLSSLHTIPVSMSPSRGIIISLVKQTMIPRKSCKCQNEHSSSTWAYSLSRSSQKLCSHFSFPTRKTSFCSSSGSPQLPDRRWSQSLWWRRMDTCPQQ